MSDPNQKDRGSSKNEIEDIDPATKRENPKRGRSTSKDIREDRGIRQHKLGKHKN